MWKQLHAWLQLERARVPGGQRDGQGVELQSQCMGRAHTPPGRRRGAGQQQPLRKSDPPLGNGLFIVPLFVKCLKTLGSGSRKNLTRAGCSGDGVDHPLILQIACAILMRRAWNGLLCGQQSFLDEAPDSVVVDAELGGSL